ncbi:germin-like protein subfamily 1 member 16 [Rhodamnia argentea]|uniref:Germin-like protein n=1 Tax=Rhodamnia argentea TaxID=178133 RepID=A0A8B8QLT9_9MYRT|nr:germin-like protein subfamily 1 member 16 [Rhodamnia argentea]XP_048129696.1 germin-like protein subfamily 1 member 16 [Rhodamnia argentea]
MSRSVRLSAGFALLALALSFVSAYDPSPLQDICVAVKEPENALFVNGKFCKNPHLATAKDFLFSGLQVPRSTANPLGSTVTPVTVDQIPGLNTLGISMARVDFGIEGLNPPHTHPRGTEILLVLEGTLYVGFVTSNQLNNTLFAKVLYPGDVFIFPIGMIHFQLNVGKTNAVAIAALSSQNPGVITIANALFNAKPPISPEVLAKGFQIEEKLVETLQKKLWYYN